MKEMGNNDFIHTLDAVYNLCSEIKELVNTETEKQVDEGNEGIILLSDNLQRLQSEITEMKTGLSSDSKHSKKCTFYTLRFGCSFAAVNTIKPQLL